MREETCEEEGKSVRACVCVEETERDVALVGMIHSQRNEYIDKSSMCKMGYIEFLPLHWSASVRAFPFLSPYSPQTGSPVMDLAPHSLSLPRSTHTYSDKM